MRTRVKTAEEIANMRESGRQLATVLHYLMDNVRPGMTEKQLANMAEEKLNELGGKPVFKGYHGFPSVICISVNDAVVHGIPTDRPLQNGDILSLDFGVNYKGMITDSARTMIVGTTPDMRLQQLVAVTKQSLMAGINAVRDGARVGDIGAAVEAVINMHGYGIVRELVGHGVGHELHESPDIPNYGRAGSGFELKAGMTIAIEPMVNLGTERVVVEDDGWTIRTADGKPSAHFEHTILVTKDGAEILTEI